MPQHVCSADKNKREKYRKALFVDGTNEEVNLYFSEDVKSIDNRSESLISIYLANAKGLLNSKRTTLYLSMHRVGSGNELNWQSNHELRLFSNGTTNIVDLSLGSFYEGHNYYNIELRDANTRLINTYQLVIEAQADSQSIVDNASGLIPDYKVRSIFSKIFNNSTNRTNIRKNSSNNYVLSVAKKSFHRKASHKNIEVDNSDIKTSKKLLTTKSDVCNHIQQEETIISQGVAGPAGDQGPTGPAGPAGPAGTDGSIGVAGLGAFTTTANIVSNALGDYDNDDWVVGSPSLVDDANPDHDSRMFFDKSNGSFRAGRVTGTEWDTTSSREAIFGENNFSDKNGNTFMSGRNSHSSDGQLAFMGENITGLGRNNIAIGTNLQVHEGFAIGHDSHENGSIGEFLQSDFRAMALGRGVDTGNRMRANSGSIAIGFNSDDPTLFLEGGGEIGIGRTSPAQQLHIEGDILINEQASPPGVPADGQLYMDDSGAFCARVNGAWVNLTGAGACS